MRELDRRLGLSDAISACLRDPRDQRSVLHQQRDMLAQRLFAIAARYEDLNDHETTRDEPLLQTTQSRSRSERGLDVRHLARS